jgi:prepilin-type N-terminal cleavage/methylation domain-containing protein
MKKYQKGVTLIEMILVVALIAIMTVMTFMQKQLEMEQVRARAVGVDLYVYNNAVRNWLSENISTTPLNVTRNGTTWLKPTSCGGSSGRTSGYIPCTFPDSTTANPMNFSNMVLTTVLTRTILPNGEVQTKGVTTTTPFKVASKVGAAGEVRADLSGLAAITAASGVISAAQMTPNMATTDGVFKSDPLTGIITMEASNSADSDAWLRTDGGNSMNNNLKFTSTLANTLRQVIGASRIQSNSNTDTLYIGNQNNSTAMPANGGGSLALDTTAAGRESVVIDANARIYGRLRTNGAITAISGNITASAGNVAASQDVTAGRDVVAQGNVFGMAFYDQDNRSYYVNPATTSVLNRVNLTTLSSQNASSPVRIVSNRINFSHWSGGTNETVLNGYVNANSLYVNKNGKKVPLNQLISNYVHIQSYFAMHGQNVPVPTCAAGGSPKIIVTPQTIPTNTARPVSGYTTPPVGATFFYAQGPSGGNWRVISTTWSGAYGGEGTAIASTYCLY